MKSVLDVYRPGMVEANLDLYALTMLAGYLRGGTAAHPAVFNGFIRRYPLQGGLAISGGLQSLISYLQNFQVADETTEYLRGLNAGDGSPLFTEHDLEHIKRLKLSGDLWAVPDGTFVTPQLPMLQYRGPRDFGAFMEVAVTSFFQQTLYTTRAARIRLAAGNAGLMEMAPRRGTGPGQSLMVSLGSYIGGFDFSSNVLGGQFFGIPTKGTFAHAWVSMHKTEQLSFEAFFERFPHNSTFLIDTYDPLVGIRRAVELGVKMKERGFHRGGIRIDGGDYAYLARFAKGLFQEHGLTEWTIGASGDRTEKTIQQMRALDAPIDWYGIGEVLLSGNLGMVWKLGATWDETDEWRDVMKVIASEPDKMSLPGAYQARRATVNGQFECDQFYLPSVGPQEKGRLFHPKLRFPGKHIPEKANWEELLVPVFRNGELVYDTPSVAETRERAAEQIARLQDRSKSLEERTADAPGSEYPAGMDLSLHQLREKIMQEQLGA